MNITRPMSRTTKLLSSPSFLRKRRTGRDGHEGPGGRPETFTEDNGLDQNPSRWVRLPEKKGTVGEF